MSSERSSIHLDLSTSAGRHRIRQYLKEALILGEGLAITTLVDRYNPNLIANEAAYVENEAEPKNEIESNIEEVAKEGLPKRKYNSYKKIQDERLNRLP